VTIRDKVKGWLTGTGEPPPRPANTGGPQGITVVHRWARHGDYTIRALRPMDSFAMRLQLASMLGRDLLACVHDVMQLAATGDAVEGVNFRAIWGALRAYVAQGNPPDREVVREAAGELWKASLRKVYEVMPEEAELDLPAFLTRGKPFLAALAPVLAAIDPDVAMDIVRRLLIVKQDGGAGLYVRDQPCLNEGTINAIVPHEDLGGIIWWALLFNLHPFTAAARNTAPSSGRSGPGAASRGPTPSRPGPAGASATSTDTHPRK
jgi:hypothetical protein